MCIIWKLRKALVIIMVDLSGIQISKAISTFNCCVFRPANGCSARRSLVKIICFTVKTSFLSLSITNGRKRNKKEMKAQKEHRKTCIKTLSFLFFLLLMEKDKKTYFFAEPNDFDQQTACRAPVSWLKYTTLNIWNKNILLINIMNVTECLKLV